MKKGLKRLINSALIVLILAPFLEGNSSVYATDSNASAKSNKTMITDNSNVQKAKDTRSVDDWMPDKNLQRYLLDKFPEKFPDGVITQDILYRDIKQLQVSDLREYDVKNLTGLEFIQFPEFKTDYGNEKDIRYLNNMRQNFYNVFPYGKGNFFQLVFGEYNEKVSADKFFETTFKMAILAGNAIYYGDIVSKQLVSKNNYKSISVDFMILQYYSIVDSYGRQINNGDEYSFLINDKIVTYKVSNYKCKGWGGILDDYGISATRYIFNLNLKSKVSYADLANNTSNVVFLTDAPLFNELNAKVPIHANPALQLQFAPEQGGNVVAHYQNEDGDKIVSDETLQGEVGTEYKTEQKNIDGYTFKKVKGNPSGTFTKDEQSVTYIYVRNVMPVHVEYVDESGNKISDGYDITGEAGDKKQVDKKDIDGYKFKEFRDADDKNENVILGDKERTVKVVYTKNASPAKPDAPIIPKNNGSNSKPSDNKSSNSTVTNAPEDGVDSVTKSYSNSGNLPQTGEDIRNASILSIIGVILISLVGYTVARKRKN